MHIRPITLKAANAYVRANHRHHTHARGCVFCLALYTEDTLCGVAIIGRPVARNSDDGLTCELTRLCTDGTPNAPSKLLSAARRAAQALGYRRIITHTLATEPGTSLIAAGWIHHGTTRAQEWGRPSRPRAVTAPTDQKQRWSCELQHTS